MSDVILVQQNNLMFQVPAIITKIETTADNGIKLVVHTQELPPAQASEVFLLKGRTGFFLFKDNPLELNEVPNEPAPEFKGERSPGQHLRSVLYKFWELCTPQKPNFESFYREWIAKKVSEIKELLP